MACEVPVEDHTELERRVLEAVTATGEPYELIEIDPELAETATFCEQYGYPLATSGNCILVASKDDPPVLAAGVALATTKLDVNKRLRKLLGVRKLSFAPPELTRERTGMEVGGVTPFALPADLPVYLDARIADLDRVVVGGGGRRFKLSVPPSALTAVGGEYVEELALPL